MNPSRSEQQLEDRIAALESILRDGRVRIRNLEGSLKTLSSAPVAGDGWEDGAVVLSDISGTRKLNAYIAGAWYSVTLT